MKHIFVVNPIAGKGNFVEGLCRGIKKTFDERDDTFEIHMTTAPKEAINFVRTTCEQQEGELRFYACGGDGTLSEVASGAMGFPQATVASVPCGSGNDFVRNFGAPEDFYRVDKLADGEAYPIDIIKFGGETYGINMCNMGFDANVALNMNKFKRLPFISGRLAYSLGVIYSLFHKMSNQLRINVDGEVIEGEFLLAVLGSGCYCGGGFKCTPLAEVDDGMLDLCIVKKVPRLKLLQLVKSYKKGEHLYSEKFANAIIYRRCKKIEVTSPTPFAVSIDGENQRLTQLTAEVLRQVLYFAVPNNSWSMTKSNEGIKSKMKI